MRQTLNAESERMARITAVQSQPSGKNREIAARQLVADLPAANVRSSALAMAMVKMLRDASLWNDVTQYIDALPQSAREQAWMSEQRALALSKSSTSTHLLAIGQLKELIRRQGGTSERWGLVGGRYKKLAAAAKDSDDPQIRATHSRYLNDAIDAYEKGMAQDLVGYYPVSNLARLYRERNRPDDAKKAEAAVQITMACCEALRSRGAEDEWLKCTLLGTAFDAADLETATTLTDEVESQGPAEWQLESAIRDLRKSVAQIKDAGVRADFEGLLARLTGMLSGKN
jgi:hypothetical protein